MARIGRYIALAFLAAIGLCCCGKGGGEAAAEPAVSVSPQEIADFLVGLSGEDEATASRRIDSLVASAAGDTTALAGMAEIMERYLDEPNSPLRNEALYIVFLEALTQQSSVEEGERIIAKDKLATARKNSPGDVATDFAYIDREGRQRTLRATSGRRLLLIFYDPECGHCSEVLEQVSESAVLKDCIANKRLTVLAVYTEGNRGLWEATKASMPQEWAVGFDTDSIVDRELYSVPAMPVMYLLDSDKTVLLKDAFLPEIEGMLTVKP